MGYSGADVPTGFVFSKVTGIEAGDQLDRYRICRICCCGPEPLYHHDYYMLTPLVFLIFLVIGSMYLLRRRTQLSVMLLAEYLPQVRLQSSFCISQHAGAAEPWVYNIKRCIGLLHDRPLGWRAWEYLPMPGHQCRRDQTKIYRCI